MGQYRIASPKEFRHGIKDVLRGMSLLLRESRFIHENLSSCRVRSRSSLSLDISIHRKEFVFEHAQFSGYSEFLEQLENRLLLNSVKEKLEENLHKEASHCDDLDFKWEGSGRHILYAIDEKEVSPDYFFRSWGEELRKMCAGIGDGEITDFLSDFSDKETLTAIPFYSVSAQKESLLPIELLLSMTASNGMAIGDTPQKAILLAIYDILERYVIREIYWKQLALPVIPLDYFKNSVAYQELLALKKKMNYDFIVKDCSLGHDLPALGLLVVDKVRRLYHFKVGVDCVPEIALEKCLNSLNKERIGFSRLSYKCVDTSTFDEKQEKELTENLMNILVSGEGDWPVSIFKNEHLPKFSGFNREVFSGSDLNFCIDLITQLGYNIYIRDNSILESPTYYVVIPGMSQIYERLPQKTDCYTESMNNLGDVNKLGRIDTHIAHSLLIAIDENYSLMKEKHFELQKAFVYNVNPDLNSLSVELLGSLLSYYLKDYKKTLKYLKLYLETYKVKSKYLDACQLYLTQKIEGQDAFEMISALYGESMAKEVITDFRDERKIFQYYKLPNCPYCTSCNLRADCRARQIRTLHLNITRMEKQKLLDQMKIQDYLEEVKT